MRRRVRWWLIGASGAAVVVLAGAGSLALVAAIEHIGPLRFTNDREHLDEISIPKAACPSVEAIHGAANDFQLVYTSAVLGFDTNLHAASWPELRAEVDRSALALTAAVDGGIPSFPRPIRRRLTRVRAALVEGRARLGAVTEVGQLDNMTEGLFRVGQEQFGLAGDLVGGQCRVPLRADDRSTLFGRLDTIPPSSTPTTTSVPAVPAAV